MLPSLDTLYRVLLLIGIVLGVIFVIFGLIGLVNRVQ